MAWSETVAARPPDGAEVLDRLGALCESRGLSGLAERLAELTALVSDDMVALERTLTGVASDDDVVRRSATHLLMRPGKRLRPMCVVLAARVGTGFDERVADLAIAVELVHAATLLHDDVVDLGDVRRGAPAARTVYGNAASIFAGDWLLVDALMRVRRARVEGALDRLLSVIDEMIRAEAIQLERRGTADPSREVWTRVVEGKTAALFRWAMFAGGRAGGLSDAQCAALEDYGTHLGVAFQAVDDVLDLTGDAAVTGKQLFADVREGKMTWPLIVAVEREPLARRLLERVAALSEEQPVPLELRTELVEVLRRTEAVEDCLALARERGDRAVRALDALPTGRATEALATVAEAAISREA